MTPPPEPKKHRISLPASAGHIDWDPTGSHLLLTKGDGVRHYHDGRFSAIPAIDDVFGVAWWPTPV